ncbi:hypothetical protein Thiowin_00293 [Thiorhodovibrio winogradskyi]|uniref:Uncharacterized protein n=1 Tax=Thiorhodovibrio winogradskyi TaxID=77007 RepID=A0ABZ0S4A8_9GAMM
MRGTARTMHNTSPSPESLPEFLPEFLLESLLGKTGGETGRGNRLAQRFSELLVTDASQLAASILELSTGLSRQRAGMSHFIKIIPH